MDMATFLPRRAWVEQKGNIFQRTRFIGGQLGYIDCPTTISRSRVCNQVSPGEICGKMIEIRDWKISRQVVTPVTRRVESQMSHMRQGTSLN